MRWRSRPTTSCWSAAVELQAARSALDAAEAHVLGELRVRGVTDRCFGMKTAKWVAAQAKVDHRAIGRRERFGSRLRQLPEVDAGGGGRVDHRRSRGGVGRGGGQPAHRGSGGRDRVDLDRAGRGDVVRGLEASGRQTVALLDQDGGYDPEKDRDRERLRFTTLDEGITRLAADLVGVDALEVRQLVEARPTGCSTSSSTRPTAPRICRCRVGPPCWPWPWSNWSAAGRSSTATPPTGPAVDVTLVIHAEPTRPHRPRHRTPPSTDTATGAVAGEDGCVTPAELWGHCGPALTTDGEVVHPEVAAILLCDPIITVLVVDLLGGAVGHGPQDPPGQPRPTPSPDPTRRRLHLPGL